MGSGYQKRSYPCYHDGFKFSDLKTTIDTVSSNWMISNKITEKFALPIVRTLLPILDDFQIFAKCPAFE